MKGLFNKMIKEEYPSGKGAAGCAICAIFIATFIIATIAITGIIILFT